MTVLSDREGGVLALTLLQSEDHREGLAAIGERREPLSRGA